MAILKFICLFLAIWLGYINIGCLLITKEYIPAKNIFLMSLGITGFIFLQFNLM